MLKDHNALRTVTDLVTEHIQTTFSDIDAVVGKFKGLPEYRVVIYSDSNPPLCVRGGGVLLPLRGSPWIHLLDLYATISIGRGSFFLFKQYLNTTFALRATECSLRELMSDQLTRINTWQTRTD